MALVYPIPYLLIVFGVIRIGHGFATYITTFGHVSRPLCAHVNIHDIPHVIALADHQLELKFWKSTFVVY